MTSTLDNTANRKLLTSIKNIFLNNSAQTYQYLQILSLSLLFVMLSFVSVFFLNSKLTSKPNIKKFLYWTKSIIKVTAEFCFSIFAIVLYRSITTKNYFMIVVILIEIILLLFWFKVGAFFEQNNKFETEDLYAHN